MPMKNYSEKEVVMLIVDMMMVHMGDEWVPQLDEGFIDWLIKEGLYNTFEEIYIKN